MKTKVANLRGLNILGNGDWLSDGEILTAILKRWRQTLGYCSIFAAVPAILASHIAEARSDEPKKPEARVAGPTARLLVWPNIGCSNPELLKRQSKFLLPHQKGSFSLLAALAGNDDCPGRVIPGGNYTASAPYTDSGDTTSANDTVTIARGMSGFFCYYSYDAVGPDHIYSFTLTGRGANPQVEVSRTSGSYSPMVYILDGRAACPTGTGNSPCSMLVLSGSSPGGTATLSSGQMNFLPLNVPLHLFVDSARNDASGSGPYTIRIQDVTIAQTCPNPNPIDCTDFFVRQHYIDFLNRGPDPPGFAEWQALLNSCLPGDTSCDRIHVSAAFFQSPEFQQRGYFVYRFYPVSFGRKPDYAEFTPDIASVSGFLSATELEAAKVAFIVEFMARPAFVTKFNGLTNTQYVDTLLSTADITHSGRDFWIEALGNGTRTRAQVLREIAESTEVYQKYYNQSFVVMQYFGYLRRDPDALYLDWIEVLDSTGEPRHMIEGFVNSIEYRARFAP